MFKIGDKVKFKKSSIDTGMIDAEEEDVFTVLHVSPGHMILTEMEEWWNAGHFEHVKEEIMNNTEEDQEIKWEVGQVVWDVMFGQGVVTSFDKYEQYGVDVEFSKWGLKTFTVGGAFNDGANRTLFFSEPIVTAELFPPKKLFVPTLKKGDMVVVNTELGPLIHSVYGESETHLYCNGQDYAKGKIASVFKLGEEIKFN